MAFQPGPHNLTGGVSYEDAFNLLLMRQSDNQYPLEPVSYLPQPSSDPYQPLEHDYTKIYQQTSSKDPLPQPPPKSDAGQQKMSEEIMSALDELKQGMSSIEAKVDNLAANCDNLAANCNNLAATVSKLQDWMKTSINQIKEYVERHKAWSLIFKRAVENQIRDRDSTRDRATGSEDSAVES